VEPLNARWEEIAADLANRNLVVCPHGAQTLLASSGPIVHWPEEELPELLDFATQAGGHVVYAELVNYTEQQLRLLHEDDTSEELLAQARSHLRQPAFIALAVLCEGILHGWVQKATWYANLLEQQEIDEFVSDVEKQERAAKLQDEAAAWSDRLVENLAFRRAPNYPAREAAALAEFPQLRAFLAGFTRRAGGGTRVPAASHPIYQAADRLPEVRRRVVKELGDNLQGLARELAETPTFQQANTKDWRKRVVRQFLQDSVGFNLPELVPPLESAASAVLSLPQDRPPR
jgi:hypothetical protein